MKYLSIRGEEVPALGLGTWGTSDHRCVRAVETALELGYRHLDTAQRYGNEREVGLAIERSDVDREECFLTTKIRRGNLRYDDVISSTRASLERLGTEYVDLLLIHHHSVRVPVEETLDAMARLRDEGSVRHVGVSNFSLESLRTADERSSVPLFTDQVQYHPYTSQDELLDYCRERGALLTAYSPLLHGGLVNDERLVDVGERYGKNAVQVALRWLVQQEMVAAIPKATSRDHLEENLAIFDFELTDEEMREIARPSALRTGAGWIRGLVGR